jgi:imidazole glycerol-phosphate synthase subunit HisH
MIAIIDYGVGNLGSIANMLKKVGVKSLTTSDVNAIADAEKLILPGVGAFDNGMQNLRMLGLVDVLNQQVLEARKPILGLCLGMQLFSHGSEEGVEPGLGWLDATTVRFGFGGAIPKSLKIPHMGWNYIKPKHSSALLVDLPEEPRFYFVHSYHLVCTEGSDVLASTAYGYDFPSIVHKDNIYGAQFHPEKSHKFGMALLRNFAEQVPC